MKNYYVVLLINRKGENSTITLCDFKFQEVNTKNIEEFVTTALSSAKDLTSFSMGTVISWQEVREV